MVAPNEEWGSPAAKHFVRRNIREVKSHGRTFYVHREVTHIMAAFLVAVEDAYHPIPDTAFGWADRGDAWQRLGLRLDLPGLDVVAESLLALAAARLGLTAGDGYVVFEGQPFEAEAITRDVIQESTTAEASIEVGFLDRHRPGTRPLTLGDAGPDVVFLQEFLRAESVHARYDDHLAERVRGFQHARGLPETGDVDRATWLSMFPERIVQVDPGDGGMWVRMVQALLIALDYSVNAVTNVYGTRTTRDVRDLQKLHGLRVTGIVRGPEWGVLVHRPTDTFPLADTPSALDRTPEPKAS